MSQPRLAVDQRPSGTSSKCAGKLLLTRPSGHGSVGINLPITALVDGVARRKLEEAQARACREGETEDPSQEQQEAAAFARMAAAYPSQWGLTLPERPSDGPSITHKQYMKVSRARQNITGWRAGSTASDEAVVRYVFWACGTAAEGAGLPEAARAVHHEAVGSHVPPAVARPPPIRGESLIFAKCPHSGGL